MIEFKNNDYIVYNEIKVDTAAQLGYVLKYTFAGFTIRINEKVYTKNTEEFREAIKKAYMWEKLKQ